MTDDRPLSRWLRGLLQPHPAARPFGLGRTLFTLAALFGGFYSIVMAMR